jgi:N-carbamoyl-L-amino-acid hydrolase
MPSNRWKEDLVELGSIGRKIPMRVERFDQLDSEKGLYRREGTTQMKESKDYIVERLKEAGLLVRIDRVGNIFGRKEGSASGLKAVMSGSHLDSVVNGGMFDGALGVVSALEAIRMMNEEGFDNKRPIEVAVFMGEEGSAFERGLLGSDVVVGKTAVSEALSLKNGEGITLDEVLKRTGYKGTFELDLSSVEYFIELHVEQGPILDKENIPIGIVEHISGTSVVSAVLIGEANHAGTTPMSARKDALVAAAQVVLFLHERANQMAKEIRGSTVATVGNLEVIPGQINIIPGTVKMGIDIRDSDEGLLQRLIEETLNMIANLETAHRLACKTEVRDYHRPQPLSKEIIAAFDRGAYKANVPTRRMNSGAGHDAMNMAQKVKTGMIFVPSINGISHSPIEWTNWEDIEKGVQVLKNALQELSCDQV